MGSTRQGLTPAQGSGYEAPVATLMLEGIRGAAKGFSLRLNPGEALIGRSRSCGLSLFRVSAACRSVSKCHAALRLAVDGRLEIEDLSRHGTFLDDDRIDTAILTDLAHRSHSLRLGRAVTFRLLLGP